MHCIENTIYHATDKDCWGLKKGEFKQIVNGKTKLPVWRLKSAPYKLQTVDAAERPESVTLRYVPFGRTGEGKEPDLDAARQSAIWPDATLEQLRDRVQLGEHLLKLMVEFQQAVEELGFVY